MRPSSVRSPRRSSRRPLHAYVAAALPVVMLATASPAAADEPSPPAAPAVAEPQAQPAEAQPAPDAEPPRAAAPQPLQLFRQAYLQFDVKSGEATRGQDRTPLTHAELFGALGRPDLIEAEESQRTTRNVLYASSIVTALAGLGLGLWIRSGIPDLNQPSCWVNGGDHVLKSCTDDYRSHELWSGVAIVGGLLAGAGLFTVASSMTVDGAPRTTIAGMVATYNGSLMQKLRGGQTASSAYAPQMRLTLSPSVSHAGGGLSARLTF